MQQAKEVHLGALDLMDSFNSDRDKATPNDLTDDQKHRFIKSARWGVDRNKRLIKDEDDYTGDTFKRRIYLKLNGNGSYLEKYKAEVIEEACRIMHEVYGLDIAIQLKYRSKKMGGKDGDSNPYKSEKALWEDSGIISQMIEQIPEGLDIERAYIKMEFRRKNAPQMDAILRDISKQTEVVRLFVESKANTYQEQNKSMLQRAANPSQNPVDFSIMVAYAARALRIASGIAEKRPFESVGRVWAITTGFVEGLRGHEFSVVSKKDLPEYQPSADFLNRYIMEPSKHLGHDFIQWMHANPKKMILYTSMIGMGISAKDAISNNDSWLIAGLAISFAELGVILTRNPNNTGRGKT